MSRADLSYREFCDVVREAVESIPAPFQHWMQNVVVDVEENPDPKDLAELDAPPDQQEEEELLLGLFIGTSITEQEFGEHAWNTIKIYRQPLLQISDTRQDLKKNIQDTVLHELAHHFGYDEDDLEEFEATR